MGSFGLREIVHTSKIICLRTYQLRQLSGVRPAPMLAMCRSRCMIFANCDSKPDLFDVAQ